LSVFVTVDRGRGFGRSTTFEVVSLSSWSVGVVLLGLSVALPSTTLTLSNDDDRVLPDSLERSAAEKRRESGGVVVVVILLPVVVPADVPAVVPDVLACLGGGL